MALRERAELGSWRSPSGEAGFLQSVAAGRAREVPTLGPRHLPGDSFRSLGTPQHPGTCCTDPARRRPFAARGHCLQNGLGEEESLVKGGTEMSERREQAVMSLAVTLGS